MSFFPNFTVFIRIMPDDYYSQFFTSADTGNQLIVKPNVVVGDDAMMQPCATAHCAYKTVAVLTRETSELTSLDL